MEFNFIGDKVEQGLIKNDYLSSSNQLADV